MKCYVITPAIWILFQDAKQHRPRSKWARLWRWIVRGRKG